MFMKINKEKKVTFSIKSIVMLFVLSFCIRTVANAQDNEYENALSKFTGEHKYDIEHPGSMDGIAAPDFKGKTIDGKKVQLSNLKGKVVVLNFWFIACVPCRLEVGPLNEVVEHFGGEEVVFLSVAREKEADLKKHLDSTKFLFQTIADPEYNIVKDTFHLFGYPTTIVIDKEGKIRYYTLGGKIDEAAVRKELQQKLIPAITSCLN